MLISAKCGHLVNALQEIREGQLPYLFGGVSSSPGCRHCRSSDQVAPTAKIGLPSCMRWKMIPHYLSTYMLARDMVSASFQVAQFCRFGMDGHGQCWGGRRERLVQEYLERGFTEILTFTPCDLLPVLKGRTLFFSGDSQTQVRLPAWVLYSNAPGDWSL